MVKRQAMQSIEAQKVQMIAALYANTNMDMKENDRPERIKELERHFNKAIEIIYNDGKDPDENEIDWNNPFWAAAKRAYERKAIMVEGKDRTVSQVVGDDAAARIRSNRTRDLDQVAS